MVTDQNKMCTITNNTGKDIIIALATANDETANSGAVKAANGRLEILQTVSGSPVIKAGSSGSVTLNRNYTGNGGYVQAYDLQVCDSNWLYPIASLPVTQVVTNGTTGFSPQTITADSGAGMEQAVAFYQTVAAYPASQLAKDYMAALQASQVAAAAKAGESPDPASAAADALAGAIKTFFENTAEYKNATLADVVSVDNYYNNFPCIWARYADETTYYLYGVEETAATFAGTLTLKKSGLVDAATDGGYTCLFNPATTPADTTKTDVDLSKAVTLHYNNGVFVDNADASALKIGLKGNFMLKRIFTGQAEDNSVMPVITGALNGASSIGFDKPQTGAAPVPEPAEAATATTPDWDSYWDTLTHPKNLYDYLISILTLAGALLVIPATSFALYNLYRVMRYKAWMREAVDKTIIERTYDEQMAFRAQEEKVRFEMGTWFGKGTPHATFVEMNYNNMEDYYAVLENNAMARKLLKAYNLAQESLKEMLRYEIVLDLPTKTALADASIQVRDTMEALTVTKRTELDHVLPDALSSYTEVQGAIEAATAKLGLKIRETSQALIQKNKLLSDDIYNKVKDTAAVDTKVEADRDPDAADKLILEFEKL